MASRLVIPFLFLLAFSLTTYLDPWYQSWTGNRTRSVNIMSVALGDSRRLFAKHFYVKADAYFHNGYYPSIYDQQPAPEQLHMATEAQGGKEEHKEASRDFLGEPKDWIDRFNRHFYPSRHRHLDEEEEPSGNHAGHHEGSSLQAEEKGKIEKVERELLPWLRLAADLDPQRTETYIVASHWMRTRLGKVTEAEQFLREGLRANPEDSELLFELGKVYFENRKNVVRARNLWVLALNKSQRQTSAKTEANIFLYAQILGSLAKLEEEDKRYAKAIEYLQLLKVVSPSKENIQKWMDTLRQKESS